MKQFEFVEHTADAEFYSYGSTIEEAYAHAAYAVTSIIVDYKKVKAVLKKIVKIRGKDKEALLYNFIEEIIYLLDAEDFVMHKVQYLEIKKDKNGFSLEAELLGDTVSNYQSEKAVKAATYNSMEIKQENGKWIVHMVVDI
ncbi:MAG TPA: archease [Candidatus Nanoarchaeia archaeon]|nr:archease [Candidatus Nanoarchaeia archaeon]